MANNQVFDRGYKQAVVVTIPASPTSGSPVRFGSLTGVALADMRTADSLTPCDFGPGVWTLSVHAYNGTAGTAVAAGDPLYFTDADTPAYLDVNTAGHFFGYAMQAVTSGATTAIKVLHITPARP